MAPDLHSRSRAAGLWTPVDACCRQLVPVGQLANLAQLAQAHCKRLHPGVGYPTTALHRARKRLTSISELGALLGSRAAGSASSAIDRSAGSRCRKRVLRASRAACATTRLQAQFAGGSVSRGFCETVSPLSQYRLNFAVADTCCVKRRHAVR